MPRPASRVMWEKHGGAVRKHKRRIHADNLGSTHGVMIRAVVRSRPAAMAPTLDHLVGPNALLLHGLPERLVSGIQHGVCCLGAGNRIGAGLQKRVLILPFTDEPLSLRHSLALAVRAQDAISGRLVHLVAQRQRTRSVFDNKTLHALGGLHRLGHGQQSFCSWRIQPKNTALPPAAHNAPGKVGSNVTRPLAKLVSSRDGSAGAFNLLAHEADNGLAHVLADPLLGTGVHHIEPSPDSADADGAYLSRSSRA